MERAREGDRQDSKTLCLVGRAWSGALSGGASPDTARRESGAPHRRCRAESHLLYLRCVEGSHPASEPVCDMQSDQPNTAYAMQAQHPRAAGLSLAVATSRKSQLGASLHASIPSPPPGPPSAGSPKSSPDTALNHGTPQMGQVVIDIASSSAALAPCANGRAAPPCAAPSASQDGATSSDGARCSMRLRQLGVRILSNTSSAASSASGTFDQLPKQLAPALVEKELMPPPPARRRRRHS